MNMCAASILLYLKIGMLEHLLNYVYCEQVLRINYCVCNDYVIIKKYVALRFINFTISCSKLFWMMI